MLEFCGSRQRMPYPYLSAMMKREESRNTEKMNVNYPDKEEDYRQVLQYW